MKENLIPLITGIIFLILGIFGVFFPEKVQKSALKWSVQGLSKYISSPDWIKSRSYIWTLRFFGILAIVASILSLLVVFK